jgi:Fe-S cluster assembly scaffold protein SufB
MMSVIYKDHIETYSQKINNKYNGKINNITKKKDLERNRNMASVKSWLARYDK